PQLLGGGCTGSPGADDDDRVRRRGRSPPDTRSGRFGGVHAAVALVHLINRHRVQGRRTDGLSRFQVEGRVVPRATDLTVSAQTVGERSAVVGAAATERMNGVRGTDDYDRLPAHMSGLRPVEAQFFAWKALPLEVRSPKLTVTCHRPSSV